VNASGTSIYYSTSSDQGGSAIYRLDLTEDMDPEEEEAETLPQTTLLLECPEGSCSSVVVSPREDFIAYERVALPGGEEPNYPRVWLLPLTMLGGGGEPRPLLAGSAAHQTLGPVWSSDGLLTFYDTNAAEYVILNPRDGAQTAFPNLTGGAGAWHPNGVDFIAPEIIFLDEQTSEGLSDLQSLANSHLILFNWQDETTRDLTRFEELEDTSPAFSPDGAYLVFARKNLQVERWTPGRQIWLMRSGTWEAEPLTDDPLYNHFEFTWSPGGDVLAYVRFNQTVLTEPPEIWVMDPFIDRATQVIVGGFAPQWIP